MGGGQLVRPRTNGCANPSRIRGHCLLRRLRRDRLQEIAQCIARLLGSRPVVRKLMTEIPDRLKVSGDRTNDRRQDRQSAELAGRRLSPETFQNHLCPRLACGSHRRASNHPFHQSGSRRELSSAPAQTCRPDRRRPPRETCSRMTVLLGRARWMRGQACHLAKSRQRGRVADRRTAGAQGSPKRDGRQRAHPAMKTAATGIF